MASAYSILHNYSQELYRPNLQLISTALQAKQGALNANRAKLQNVYDSLTFIDIAKDQDKEYTENRLQTAKGIIDKYSALDLSDSNFTDGLVSKLSEVVDENVQTAIVSTARLRSEQSAWEKLKTDKPALYNQTNHSYANRASNAWLKDEKVGSKYKGGGGVIEYRDLGKKILDNLPDLQKSLKAKWISTGPQQGYFRSIETNEAVDRGQMEQALEFLFDSGDQRQMNIDAWGIYDQLPDEILKDMYDGYNQPRLSQANEMIDALKIARGEVSSDAEKAKYDTAIEGWRDQRDGIRSNSFENLYNTSGREAVYSTLHNRRFKNNILDTYSYAPRVIETKVDATQVANANYDLKLKNYNESRRKSLVSESLSERKFQLDVAKFQKEEEGKALLDPKRGPQIAVPTVGELSNFVERNLGREKAMIKNVSTLMTDAGLDPDALMDPEFLDQLNNLNGRTNITLIGKDGKEKKISVLDNLKTLEDYRENIVKTSAVKERAFDGMHSMIETMYTSLSISARGVNPGIDFDEEVPNFNFKIEEIDGQLTYVELQNSGRNSYKELLTRDLNSEADELTMEMYIGLHLLADDSISESDRELTRQYVDKLKSKLGAGSRGKIDAQTIASEGEHFPNSFSTVNSVDDFWLNEFTTSDLTTARAQRFLYLGSIDPAIQAAISDEKQLGLDLVMKDGFQHINKISSDVYAVTDEKLASSYKYTFTPDTKGYESLKAKAGILEADFKDAINISKRYNSDGTYSGKLNISYRLKNTTKQINAGAAIYRVVTTSAAESELLRAGVVGGFDTSTFPYDASQGESAKTIPLGNHTFDSENPLNYDKASYPNPIFTDEVVTDLYTTINEELTPGYATTYKSTLAAFEDGQYDFNLVPNTSGTYSVQIKLGDKQVFSYNTREPRFTEAERERMFIEPRIFIENAFASYLNSIKTQGLKEKAKSQ